MNFDALEGKIIAVIRLRGRRNMKPKIADTLKLLKLERTNQAVVYKATASIIGMLKVAKDYVAFGTMTKETLEALIAKRGEKGAKKASETAKPADVAEAVFAGKKIGDFIDPVFRLMPPRKGLKSVKRPDLAISEDGSVDALIKKMMRRCLYGKEILKKEAEMEGPEDPRLRKHQEQEG
jgi:large subunit ribosomal protein L30